MTSLLERLRELDEKASPAPWRVEKDQGAAVYWATDGPLTHGLTDAELIVAARNALPAVVVLVEAARQLTDACEAEFLSSATEAEGSWTDEEMVAAPNSNITFGMIRGSLAALAPFVSEATPPEGTE